MFRDILSDGRQLGINVAFTADRPGAVPSSVSSSVQRRIILRLSDDAGYSILDAPGDILNAKSVAGRAIVDNLETQVAILGGSSSVSDQSLAIKQLAGAMSRAGSGTAPPIGAMPKEYSATELPASRDGNPVLGFADDTLGPVGFDPSGVFLLAGPPASGRTNALIVLQRSLLRFDPEIRTYYIGNARSPFAALATWSSRATTVEEAVSLAKDLSAAVTDPDTEGRIAVFVENIADFLQSPADAPIVQLIKDIKRTNHFLLAEAETASWSSSWPLMAEVKSARRGSCCSRTAWRATSSSRRRCPGSTGPSSLPGAACSSRAARSLGCSFRSPRGSRRAPHCGPPVVVPVARCAHPLALE